MFFLSESLCSRAWRLLPFDQVKPFLKETCMHVHIKYLYCLHVSTLAQFSSISDFTNSNIKSKGKTFFGRSNLIRTRPETQHILHKPQHTRKISKVPPPQAWPRGESRDGSNTRSFQQTYRVWEQSRKLEWSLWIQLQMVGM